MAKAGQELLISQYGSTGSGDSCEQKLANAIAENSADPRTLTHCLTDRAASHAFIAKTVGGPAKWHLFKKTLAIGQQQLRQAVRLAPRHP